MSSLSLTTLSVFHRKLFLGDQINENAALYLYDRLFCNGEVPGTVAKLYQKITYYMIQLGRTMVAFDIDITKDYW